MIYASSSIRQANKNASSKIDVCAVKYSADFYTENYFKCHVCIYAQAYFFTLRQKCKGKSSSPHCSKCNSAFNYYYYYYYQISSAGKSFDLFVPVVRLVKHGFQEQTNVNIFSES